MPPLLAELLIHCSLVVGVVDHLGVHHAQGDPVGCLAASVPDPLKYVLVGLTGDTSVGSFRLVIPFGSAENFFQPHFSTYRDSCSTVSRNCTAALAVPGIKNTYLYPLVGAQNFFFVVARALISDPELFQGFFPFFTILNTLDFIEIILIESYP